MSTVACQKIIKQATLVYHRSVMRQIILAVVVGALLSACYSSPTTPTTPTTPTAPAPSSLAVTGAIPAVGQTSQLTATLKLSDGTTRDVTGLATWQSSNAAVATVSTSGLLRVLQLGAADITATYQTVSGKLPGM